MRVVSAPASQQGVTGANSVVTTHCAPQGGGTPSTEHPAHHTDSLLTAFQSLLYLVVSATFIITFTVQPFRIPSGSMEPTLLIGDFLLVDKQAPETRRNFSLLPPSEIRRGEIIVFHDPVDDTLHLVKRVIGVPGDHLRMRGGRVFINGEPLTEPYAIYRPGRTDDYRDNFPRLQSVDPDINSRWWIHLHTLVDRGELTIPRGNYFVLGDNRNNSEDSRYWGFVPAADIVGRPFLVYLSLRMPGGDADDADGVRQAINPPSSTSFGDRLADLARWDRTLHVVR